MSADHQYRPWFEYCGEGVSREVFLVGGLAFKLPKVKYSWRHFLQGLLANIQEREWWKNFPRDELCPVLWSIPGGWLIVMPRVTILTEQDMMKINLSTWRKQDGWTIPAEPKRDSFGWYQGRLVAVDYGN